MHALVQSRFGFRIGTSARTSAADSAARARSASSRQSSRRRAADLRFHRRDRRQADAQLIHADADQNRHAHRIAGDAAADAHPSARRIARR